MKQHFAWILIVALMSCAQTKYVAGNDTVTQTQTVTEKYVPKFYKWCTGLFWVIMAGAIALIVLKIWK